MSHGICNNCAPHAGSLSKANLFRAQFLRDRIYKRLYVAGTRNDLKAAEQIVEEAIIANCQPVDIPVGMIAPMLYKIGDGWECGALTVEDERRFTKFCEWAFELVASKVGNSRPQAQGRPFLMMNAPGNSHTLAVRFLALWLESRAITAQIVAGGTRAEELVALIEKTGSRKLLISMSLVEQQTGISKVVSHLSTLPEDLNPKYSSVVMLLSSA